MTTSTPRKVLRKASELGAHADCIAAGAKGCCAMCKATLLLAFDFYYGECQTDTIPRIIQRDLEEDKGVLAL